MPLLLSIYSYARTIYPCFVSLCLLYIAIDLRLLGSLSGVRVSSFSSSDRFCAYADELSFSVTNRLWLDLELRLRRKTKRIISRPQHGHAPSVHSEKQRNALSSDRRVSALSPDLPRCVVLVYSCSRPSYPNCLDHIYHTFLNAWSSLALLCYTNCTCCDLSCLRHSWALSARLLDTMTCCLPRTRGEEPFHSTLHRIPFSVGHLDVALWCVGSYSGEYGELKEARRFGAYGLVSRVHGLSGGANS